MEGADEFTVLWRPPLNDHFTPCSTPCVNLPYYCNEATETFNRTIQIDVHAINL